MWKKIICLANSRKISGRCIAGREIESHNWIRPVSDRIDGEISEEERQFENGKYPQVLDILSIKFLKNKPMQYQTENYLIDPHTHWKKEGAIKWEELKNYKDTPDRLWINNEDSSSQGKNDRIPENEANKLTGSLFLIYVKEVKVIVQNIYGKRKLRAEFYFNNHQYNLRVTDPRAEYFFFQKGEGEYIKNQVYLCISLGEPFGEPFKKYCYKLIATLIYKGV